MAHPDPHRAGAERDQRRHVGQTQQASDLGLQDKSQSHPGTHAAARRESSLRRDAAVAPNDHSSGNVAPGSNGDNGDDASDDVHFAPESGDKPEAMSRFGGGAQMMG